MAKKKLKAEEKINLDSILFKCRDILRAARNSGSFFEKRDMMLTLVFLRFIGEKFEDGVENLRRELAIQGLDPDNSAIKAAFLDDPTFTDGTYNLLPEARWSTIINTPAPELNVAIDAALRSIASNTPQLKGCFVEGTFTTRNLAPNDIKKLIDEVNKISHKAFGEEKDLIGRVYEYFLKEFAVNATKEEGEYYTPHDVVQLIAAMIEPFDGTLYDPCCGSGGMFIQSTELVKAKRGDISRINIYGQEKDAATYRLVKMNLALRGISHHLGETNDSSFTNDLHKGLYFNYIMANPPFNLKGWYDENLKNDARWADYMTPPESNANYAWILHMLSHLKPLDGVAGFLLANGALGDSDTVGIRKKLIQNDKVEAIIILPRELFITTDISATLWILNQNKKGGSYHGRNLRNREHEILFMDLRTWTDNPVKNENKKKVCLSTEQIERAASIYHTWQSEGTEGAHYEVPELYRSVGMAEIEKLKMLMPTKADINGRDLAKFQIVYPGGFVFNHRTSRNGSKFSIAYNDGEKPVICTEDYVVFRIKENSKRYLLAEWLYMFFNRAEFDRYVITNSWGSSTEFYNWEDICAVKLHLPSLSIQQKYVDIYSAMVVNQQSYERGLEDLKLVCDGYIEDLRRKRPSEKIGAYLVESDQRNTFGLSVESVRGLSTSKEMIPTKADMDGVGLDNYKTVSPGQIAYVPDTSRRGDKISLGFNNTQDTFLVSSISTVFGTKTEKLIPEYLMLYLTRTEFDRYTRFNSWGSARETFDWSEMCNVKIPVPDISVQKAIAEVYAVYIMRKNINEQLKMQIKDICPVLIKGSLEEVANQ